MSQLILRDYQQKCVDVGMEFLASKSKAPSLIVAPCASGKSLMISNIASKLDGRTLVIQPSKELLKQNLEKLRAFGEDAAVYSASFGSKEIDKITYATIGSIKNEAERFKLYGVDYIIIDEAHAYPPESKGMLVKFINGVKCKKVLGLTATPVRLKTYSHMGKDYCQLNILSRERPMFFSNILHVVQIKDIAKRGYWSKVQYEIHKYDRTTLKLDEKGEEFTEESIDESSKRIGLWKENEKFKDIVGIKGSVGVNNNIYLRIVDLISSGQRKNIIVFMDKVINAEKMTDALNKNFGEEIAAVVKSGMSEKERDGIIERFKKGELKVVVNFFALGVGFDNPIIDCVIFGRPTNSFVVYYQSFGRGVRPSDKKKDCLLIDCCDNYNVFGRLEDLEILDYPNYGWCITSKGRLLTGTPMDEVFMMKNIKGYDTPRKKLPPPTDLDDKLMWFGKHNGTKFKKLPMTYLKYAMENWDFANPSKNMLEFLSFCEKRGLKPVNR